MPRALSWRTTTSHAPFRSTMSARHLSWTTTGDFVVLATPTNCLALLAIRLRVPRYTAILEFLNFTCLMLAFVLCLASTWCLVFGFIVAAAESSVSTDQDKARITFWEAIFILWASACALEEYTASTENGWYSKWSLFPSDYYLLRIICDSLYCKCDYFYVYLLSDL